MFIISLFCHFHHCYKFIKNEIIDKCYKRNLHLKRVTYWSVLVPLNLNEKLNKFEKELKIPKNTIQIHKNLNSYGKDFLETILSRRYADFYFKNIFQIRTLNNKDY